MIDSSSFMWGREVGKQLSVQMAPQFAFITICIKMLRAFRQSQSPFATKKRNVTPCQITMKSLNTEDRKKSLFLCNCESDGKWLRKKKIFSHLQPSQTFCVLHPILFPFLLRSILLFCSFLTPRAKIAGRPTTNHPTDPKSGRKVPGFCFLFIFFYLSLSPSLLPLPLFSLSLSHAHICPLFLLLTSSCYLRCIYPT